MKAQHKMRARVTTPCPECRQPIWTGKWIYFWFETREWLHPDCFKLRLLRRNADEGRDGPPGSRSRRPDL